VIRLGLEHHYATLPARCFAEVLPAAAAAPSLLVFNEPLAEVLGLPDQAGGQPIDWAAVLSGNQLPADARPLAMAYAGHQYANFVPQLGDGRALLLGEKRGRDGQLHELQLKGSGRTPFSRSGDGRAAVGPMLREYLISEAMHALGIPTTRSLAVVATGERVFREDVLPGAVLTRVASSHLRVGTFQYFAARDDREALAALLDFAVARHDPDLPADAGRALAFLQRVADRQAALVAQWMAVGFIHGVMNTDNMALSGETIDYGPCAFTDHYHPQTVFSSIDHRGRYAYSTQPAIAQWNLARFAETLLPLMPGAEADAITQATQIVSAFMHRFDAAFNARMNAKLGLQSVREPDAALISTLLSLLQAGRADFTLTFRALADVLAGDATALHTVLPESAALASWLADWNARLALEGQSTERVRAAMNAVNPAVIARNHRVDAALNAASERGDLTPFMRLLTAVQQPWEVPAGADDLLQPPRDDERIHATFCGT
jgi:uncharacterized protein YdiU (UPF0061 family)